MIAGPEIELQPNEPALAKLGLTPADFQLQLQTQVAGTVISTMIDNIRVIDIRMLYPDTYKTSVQNLKNTRLLLPNGSSVPITQLATITIKKEWLRLKGKTRKQWAISLRVSITAILGQPLPI